MAQYNLAAGTQYKPFSYERYLAPLAAYNQAAQSQEDLLSDLATQANVWEGLANKQTDKETYAQYKKYADDLKAQSDILASKGLYEGSRRALLDLKNRYATEIVPIENAYKRREEQAKLQQQMRNAHPDIRYGKMASATSLDKYLNNSAYDATDQVASLDQVKNNVAMAATALSKEAHANPNIRKTLQQILPYQYYAELERNGFKSEEVYKAIHSAEGSPILKGIVDDAIKGVGIDKWDNATQMYQEAYNYASPALYNAVGTTKFGPITDQAGLATLQADLQLRNQKQQQKWQEDQAKNQQEYETGLPIATEDISFGSKDAGNAEKSYNNLKTLLGISGGNNGGTRVGIHTIEVSGGGKAGYASKAKNKNGTNKFYTCDPKKNGRIYTETEFINQGKTKHDQDILRNYYRNIMSPLLKQVAPGSRYMSSVYQKAYQNLGGAGATYQKMPKMQFGDNTKVFNDKIQLAIDKGRGAYEVTGGLHNWQTGKRLTGADVKNKLLDKDGNVKASYNVSIDPNQQGFLISGADGGRYFIPAQNLDSAASGAFKEFNDVMTYANSLKARIRAQYRGTPYEKQAEDFIDKKIDKGSVRNATAKLMRDVGFSVAGEYSDPSAKLFQQPSNN